MSQWILLVDSISPSKTIFDWVLFQAIFTSNENESQRSGTRRIFKFSRLFFRLQQTKMPTSPKYYFGIHTAIVRLTHSKYLLNRLAVMRVIVQKSVTVVMYCKWIGTVWYGWSYNSRFFVVGYYCKMDCVAVVVVVIGGCGGGDVVVLVTIGLRSNR